MISTPAPVVTPQGIHAPSFSEVLEWYTGHFKAIYGDDIYIAPDSQDGQWLGILARAQHDTNTAMVHAYNARSPYTATGAALAAVVKLTGVTRAAPTNSTVVLALGGRPNARILSGAALDPAGARWLLPSEVTLGPDGRASVEAVAEFPGAVSAAAGAIKKIATPHIGWLSVNNPHPAATGAPVESDGLLRVRHRTSTTPVALVALARVAGEVAALPGVTRSTALENDTGEPDAHGLPPHSIAVVVEGGDPDEIARTIANAKTEGATPYGTTIRLVRDAFGLVRRVAYFTASPAPVAVLVRIRNLTGYSDAVGAKILRAIEKHITALPVGERLQVTDLVAPAELYSAGGEDRDTDWVTFRLRDISIAREGSPHGVDDIQSRFNEVLTVAGVTLELTA